MISTNTTHNVNNAHILKESMLILFSAYRAEYGIIEIFSVKFAFVEVNHIAVT